MIRARRECIRTAKPSEILRGAREKYVQTNPMSMDEIDNDLIFETEHNLNTKPLQIDLLVIKKEASVQIASEIGKLFKGHNIVEYKSPEDHLDIDTFYKTLAYAFLYKSYGKAVDAIKAEDITISIIREAKPMELFRYFREHGCEIVEFSRGIYYYRRKGMVSGTDCCYGRIG